MQRIKVVLAHFNENLEWAKSVHEHCVVYDKGNSDLSEFKKFIEVIRLENIGREGATYLTFIIDHYPNFPDYTVFTQGNISDHVKSVPDFKQDIIDIASGSVNPSEYTGLNKMRCSAGWSTVTNFSDPSHNGLPLKEIYNILYDEHTDNNGSWRCNLCGIFMVSRTGLLFHSKAFYETLYDWLMDNEPIAGYTLERLWTYIFDSKVKGKSCIESAPSSNRVCPKKEFVPEYYTPSAQYEPVTTKNTARYVYNGRYTRIVYD